MKKYPDFTKNRPKGTIVKKVRDTYYVYYATSEKVEGKKYPRQVIKGLAGKVDEKGFHELNKTYVNTDDVIIRECGFTNYLLLFEEEYKSRLVSINAKYRKSIYYSFIVNLSPNSYLNEGRIRIYTMSEISENFNLGIPNQITVIEKILLHSLNEIDFLKTICFVKLKDRILYSQLTAEQLRLMKEIGVEEDEIKRQ